MTFDVDQRKVKAYTSFLRGQSGGHIPVYAGSPYQYGNGFGSFLGGLFNRLVPIVSPILKNIAGSFLSNFSSARDEGLGIMDSAKRTLAPIADTAIRGVAQAASTHLCTGGQTGHGKRRSRRRSRKLSKRKKTHKQSGAGVVAKKRSSRKRSVYKSEPRAKKAKHNF